MPRKCTIIGKRDGDEFKNDDRNQKIIFTALIASIPILTIIGLVLVHDEFKSIAITVIAFIIFSFIIFVIIFSRNNGNGDKGNGKH